MEADGLFIYGTLRAGGSHHAWLERTNPAGSCRAYSPGRLFHLPDPGFPVLMPGPEPEQPPPALGWVTGEFVGYEDLAELESALADLDQLQEGDGGFFTRQVLTVLLEGGQRYEAWVYVFSEERSPNLEKYGVELPTGDWEHYLLG